MTELATVQNFSGKQGGYARYRWDYVPAAIEWVIEKTRLTPDSTVADIGAGTGMLAAHFHGRVGQVFAIEPNAEMRQIASIPVIDGYADATTLPDHSVDLIAVGRALHWFPPMTTNAEFVRILKPGGWLAVLRIPCTDEPLLTAIQALKTAEHGWNTELVEYRNQQPPLSFYFGHDQVVRQRFPAVVQERWEDFFGRLCSFATAPTPAQPRFAVFEAAARAVFERFCVDGLLTVSITTEVMLGQPRS